MARPTRASAKTAPVKEVPKLRLTKASEISEEDIHFKFLIWGLSGAGKTHLASLAPGCLHVPLEAQAIPTVRRTGLEFGGTAMLPFGEEPVTSLDQLYEILRQAKTGELAEAGIHTLVIDSANELQRMLMDAIKAGKKKNKNVFSIQDYGTLGLRMHAALRKIRDLPLNVIFIALCEVDTTGDVRHFGPSLKGAIKHELAGYFNAAGYAYKVQREDGTVEHLVMFEGGEEYSPVKPFGDLTGIVIPDPSAWIRMLRGDDTVDLSPESAVRPPTAGKKSGGGKPRGGSGARGRTEDRVDDDDDDDDDELPDVGF